MAIFPIEQKNVLATITSPGFPFGMSSLGTLLILTQVSDEILQSPIKPASNGFDTLQELKTICFNVHLGSRSSYIHVANLLL